MAARQVLVLRKRFDPGPAGRVVTDADYDLLLTGDCDVYKPNGERLICLRRGLYGAAEADAARGVLRRLSKYKSFNRGTAAGAPGYRAMRQDGTRSNTSRSAIGVHSALLGYFDRYPRFPYCRQTMYQGEVGADFDQLRPLLECVRAGFEAAVPERYAVQLDRARHTQPDFVIRGTPWTTITVNRNWDTKLHTDAGDLHEGFSTLTVLRAGQYGGARLVFPAFRVAADLTTGDVVYMDAHEYHANTPFTDTAEGYERISLVLYYRTKMTECGTAAQELARAKALRGALDLGDEDGADGGGG